MKSKELRKLNDWVMRELGIENSPWERERALRVLEKCYDKAGMSICSCKTPNGFKLWLPNEYQSAMEAETLPLAICLFAKKLFSK